MGSKGDVARAGVYGAGLTPIRKSFLRLFFKKEVLAFLSLWLCGAADVQVVVTGIRNDHGHVRVAVCGTAEFLRANCKYFTRVPARLGEARVTVTGVPPGRYAVQAFHDENDNSVLDRNFFGMPMEGMGFSNDAPMRFGPPRFDAAAVEVPVGGAAITFRLKYY
jgi:uncharacterized protein (DUF2141 family)